jgi:hypothetical protein
MTALTLYECKQPQLTKEAIPTLEKVAKEDTDASVRNAAEGTLKQLKKGSGS